MAFEEFKVLADEENPIKIDSNGKATIDPSKMKDGVAYAYPFAGGMAIARKNVDGTVGFFFGED